MDKIDLLNSIAEMYGVKLSETRLNLYMRGLADIAIETLDAAVTEYIKIGKWMPTVAELRTAAELVDLSPRLEYRELYWWAMKNYFSDDKAMGWASRNCRAVDHSPKCECACRTGIWIDLPSSNLNN
jgi:hypothetical protein